VGLAGILSGDLEVEGRRQIGKAYSEVLNGSLAIKVEKGAIKNLNIIEEITRQADKIPGLGSALRDALVKRFPRLASTPDTDFQKAILSGKIVEGNLLINEFLVHSPEFDILGTGEFNLRHQTLRLDGRLIFSREATEALIHMVNELSYLKDTSGKVSLPFVISGKGTDLGVFLVHKVVQDALKAVLINRGLKLLGGKGSFQPSSSTASTAKGEGEEVDVVDSLIQYGLNKWLK